MPTNVLIVGMARSGTSMTASIFRRKGYFVASDESALQAADGANPSGYWEAPELLDANRRLLARAGFPFDNTWMFDPIAPSQAARMPSLVPTSEDVALVQQYEANSPWVWKDPRLCYTLGFWWPLLRSGKTAVLLVTRDRDEILRSFKRVGWRADLRRECVFQCVEEHIRSARETIADLCIPHMEIDYSDFVREPERTADRLGSFFEIDLIPSEFGYRRRYNTSSTTGRIRAFLEVAYLTLPRPVRGIVKTLMLPVARRVGSLQSSRA